MVINKNALVRYLTIDFCLQQRNRTWTLQDLIKECTMALELKCNQSKPVGKRTIQLDIQFMRDSLHGYGAPIVVHSNKFYTYSDESFSIRQVTLPNNDLAMLQHAIDFIGMYKVFYKYEETVVPKLTQLTDPKLLYDHQKSSNSVVLDNKTSAKIALRVLQSNVTSIKTIFSESQQNEFIALARKSTTSILAANSEIVNLFCNNKLMMIIEKVVADPVCIGGYMIHPKKNGPSYRKWTHSYIGFSLLNYEYEFENMIGIQFHVTNNRISLRSLFKINDHTNEKDIKNYNSDQIVFFRPTVLCKLKKIADFTPSEYIIRLFFH